MNASVCADCERCTWNIGPDCRVDAHPHCVRCGHCQGRHSEQSREPERFALTPALPIIEGRPMLTSTAIVMYVPLDDSRYDETRDMLHGQTKTAVWEGTFTISPQMWRRYRRHRQRCSNLHLPWPYAHPFGFPALPLNERLPRPWKIARNNRGRKQ